LESLLAQFQQEHASQSLTAPVPPVLDLLHAECTSSVLLSLQHNAQQASTALNAAAAQWQTAASFDASGLVHPHMPDNFAYYYEEAERGKCSSSPKNTDSKLFWNVHLRRLSIHARPWLRKRSVLFLKNCVYLIPNQKQRATNIGCQSSQRAAKVLDTLDTSLAGLLHWQS
jgi:hypothetical protein